MFLDVSGDRLADSASTSSGQYYKYGFEFNELTKIYSKIKRASYWSKDSMLKSYEAIYENGQLTWLGEQPQISSARVIVTILSEDTSIEAPIKCRIPPVALAGRVKILGDIVSPIVDEEDWECLK
jgi:hypothetical protein